MSCGPLSVRRENSTPNRANIGEISLIVLAFMIDFTITTSTNQNASGGVGYQWDGWEGVKHSRKVGRGG